MKLDPKTKSSVRKIFVKISPYLRVLLACLCLIFIVVLAFEALRDSNAYEQISAANLEIASNSNSFEKDTGVLITSPSGVEFELKEPQEEEIKQAEVKYAEKMKRLEEERRRQEEARRREKMIKVNALAGYLRRQGSPMAPFAEIIIDSCLKYGSHYCKFFLSIAGVESGFGRISIGCCNAWGIISMRWPSWEVSIPAASDWIASRYYLKGVNTFEKLAYSSYGPQNPELWIKHLYSFYNKIPL